MADNSKFTLRWEIDNATARFATGEVKSEVFEEGGFRWNITTLRPDTGPDSNAELLLRCHANHNRPWTCDADIDLNLYKANGTTLLACSKLRYSFNSYNDCWLHSTKWAWSALTSPAREIINNDKVCMEFRINIISSKRCELIADPSKFDAPHNRSDVILLIGDKKLHVSKQYLAMHSPVFETLFFGNFAEKGKKEVEIKDVVCEEFIDLLHVIYPGRIQITDATVLHVLKLGDRFHMERVLGLAVTHLRASTKFTTAQKLQLADQYKLNDLRMFCLLSYLTAREMGALESTPEYANFSADMKIAICDRVMKLINAID